MSKQLLEFRANLCAVIGVISISGFGICGLLMDTKVFAQVGFTPLGACGAYMLLYSGALFERIKHIKE